MATIINADTSNGLKLTSDTSGEIELQSAGVTKAKITSSGLQNASGVAITSQAGKNRIINGNMMIDQRNSGGVTTPANNVYTLDRWNAGLSQSSKYSVQQVVDAPSGFYNSIKATVLATVSLGATDYFMLKHKIEGNNVADLNFGTANPETITLSFWVKSSVTGTFGGGIQNSDESRGYAFNYIISSANTWEYKSVTLTGDTTGTWDKTNGTGLWLNLALGVGTTYSKSTGSWGAGPVLSATGATNLLATGSATIQFTGVQLEANTTATPFEHLQYGQQLALCQRYYERIVNTTAQAALADTYANTAGSPVPTINLAFKQTKRAAPTMALVGTFSTSNTTGSQTIFSGENTFSAYFLAAAIGRSFWYPNASSGWSADSEL
jgi:hypothetical protein